MYEGIDILDKQGLTKRCMLSFIIGFPWETEDEINQTLHTIEDISRKYGVFCNLNWLIYLPSKLWNRRYKDNIYVDEEIFDNPIWLADRELFFKVHPKISPEIVDHVEKNASSLKRKN